MNLRADARAFRAEEAAIMSDHLGNLMLRLKKQLGLTSVVVTHELDLMRKVADQVAFLDRGQVAYFGPVSALEQSDDPHVQSFLRMDRLDFSEEGLSAAD